MQPVGKTLIKYMLFLFNLIFAISGLGVLIAGCVVIADSGDYGHFLEGRITAMPVMLIIAGLLVFVIATLGCYGAVKENPKLLMTFAVLLGIIFIIELAVGIAAIAFRTDLKDFLNMKLQKSMLRRNSDDMAAWSTVQQRMMCCGIDGPKNWYDNNNQTIPSSCCRPLYIDSGTNDCAKSEALFIHRYYQDGCITKIHDRVANSSAILIGVGIGIAFVQLLGIILACWLSSAIQKENNN